MMLWIDDKKEAPSGFEWARDYDSAIWYINRYGPQIDFISFDNHLGGGKSGYGVACYIEEQVKQNKMRCPKWYIHSVDPVGSQRINDCMERAKVLSR